MIERCLALAALACLVVGAVLMVVFSDPVTRVVGIVALVAFVVLGLFAIANPDYLGRKPEE